MSRKSRTTVGVVEKLIEQRRLFQDWLTRLENGGEGMPPHVVERVRNDYRTRLTAVTTELSEHQDSLRESLDEAQERHEALEKQQATKKDELAELRLRKHVGELDEARFREESSSLGNALESLKKELSAALRDIERYEEILETIAADAKAAEPEPEPEPEEDAKPEPVAVKAAAPPPPPPPAPKIEPKPEPRPEPKADRPQTAEDELAFLRSVTTTVGAVKSPPPSPPSPRRPEQRPAGKPEPAVTIDAAPGLIQLPKSEEPAVAAAGKGKAPETAGIKCAECGTPNRPTEWYCEKCGAELTAF